MNQKKILICGGNGFIGHHLARKLKSEGNWVRVVDIKDYEYGKPDYADEIIIGDLRDKDTCKRVLLKGFDEVYNLAFSMGGAGFIFTGNNDLEIMSSNLITHNLINYREFYRKIFYSSSACFIAGTKVFTNNGFLPIEQITTAHKVISEDGNWHNVENIKCTNHTTCLVKIKSLGANDIICTPDHKFLLEDNSWCSAINLKNKIIKEVIPDLNDKNNIININIDIRTKIYMKLHKFKGKLYKFAKKYNLSPNTPYKWKKDNYFPKTIDPVTKTKIKKDFNLGKLIGLILSEGWYETHKNSNTQRLVVCFGKHEIDLIEDYKNLLIFIFGISKEKIIQYNTRTAIKIHVTSKILIKTISLLCDFKHYSKNKKLTQFGLIGPEEYRKGILEGAYLGDGCSQKMENNHFNRIIYSTISEELALQYSILLKSLKIHNSISVKKEGSWKIENRIGKTNKSYSVYTKNKNTKIKNVEILENKNTKVYNLEIKDVHSYIVEGCIVHNCIYNSDLQIDPNNTGLSENMAYPAFPDSEYGFTKLFDERLYLTLAKLTDTQVRIARFHNIMGKEGTWTGGREKAPAAFCRKIIEATDHIDMWGDGEQTRSFLYIDECIEGILRLMRSDFTGPVNIGSEEMISMNDFAKMIMNIEGKNLTINHIPGPLGVRGRNSDNTLIREKLGWSPSQPLEVGIKLTYNWIKEQINVSN